MYPGIRIHVHADALTKDKRMVTTGGSSPLNRDQAASGTAGGWVAGTGDAGRQLRLGAGDLVADVCHYRLHTGGGSHGAAPALTCDGSAAPARTRFVSCRISPVGQRVAGQPLPSGRWSVAGRGQPLALRREREPGVRHG